MKGKVDNFYNRLKDAMIIENISQQKLGELTSMNKSHINRYLSGAVNPKLNKIDLFARILNVSPVWLMGYDVPMRSFSDCSMKNSNESLVSFVKSLSNLDLNDDDLKKIYDFCLNLKGHKK